jgi:hypothetical protein
MTRLPVLRHSTSRQRSRLGGVVDGVRAECTKCGAVHVVVPPTIGQIKAPHEQPSVVELPDVPDGAQLVEADIEGRFRCKVCRQENQVSELNLK